MNGMLDNKLQNTLLKNIISFIDTIGLVLAKYYHSEELPSSVWPGIQCLC